MSSRRRAKRRSRLRLPPPRTVDPKGVPQAKNDAGTKMKVPVRTCVGCRASRSQLELVRVVHFDTGGVWVDPGPRSRSRRPAGRGAYVCPEPECITRALKTGALKRALRFDGPLPEELSADLQRRAGGGSS